MALAHARCPRCGFSCADVWRLRRFDNYIVQYLICRSCAFDWAAVEHPVSFDSRSPHLRLVFSRDRLT